MVSVIVPVYQAEKYLKYCVESLEKQTYQNIEIILIDDGSTDKSGNLCDQYAKNNSKIQVIHKKNSGVSAARNSGIQASKGKYILFVDSDDYVESDYIFNMVAAKEKYLIYDNIWCNIQTVSGYKYENCKPNYLYEKDYSVYKKNNIMTLHQMWVDASPCNKLYNVQIIKENNILFDENLSLGEDWMFNLKYLDCVQDDNIFIINKPLYNYVRNGKESLDQGYRKDMLDIYLKLNKECKYYLDKWKVDEKQYNIFYNSYYYSYEKVLKNTMKNSNISLNKKCKINNKILASKEFKNTLEKRDCYIHPLYLRAYKKRKYQLIIFLNIIYNLKQKIKGKK